jgi:hypothetical protein
MSAREVPGLGEFAAFLALDPQYDVNCFGGLNPPA